jgi:electron transfer flavoprotein alpha/beta subunit
VKVLVCVKQVAVLGDEVEFTEDERDVDPDYLDFALNEWDTYATEEALRLVEAAGSGEVVVVSVGDEDAEDAMRRCLAMGADRGIRVDSGRPGPRGGRPGRERRPRLRRRAVERFRPGGHRRSPCRAP